MDRGAPRARHERRCCMRRTRLLPRAALALALLPLGGVTRAPAQPAASPGISVPPHVARVVKPAVKPDVKPEVKPPATPPKPPPFPKGISRLAPALNTTDRKSA